MSRWRRVLAVLALTAWAVGAALSVGRPRLTLANAALAVVYPAGRALAAFGAAAAAVVLALVLRRTYLRVITALVSLATLGAGLHLLRYRVTADAAGLSARGLAGTTVVPWSEVARVEAGPGLVLITSAGGDHLRVDTTDFAPDQRAALDRAIARRLRETGAPK